MSDKTLRRFIIFSRYFPAIFLWVLVPQLAYIAGSGHLSAINTFETQGLLGVIPIPSWLVIAALITSGIIASVQELPLPTRAIPAIIISIYGLTVAINFQTTDLSAASLLGATYLIGCAVAFVIIWALSPALLTMLNNQRSLNEKVVTISEHIIKIENGQSDGAKRVANR